MQRVDTITSHWSQASWGGATVPLDKLAIPVRVALRRLQVFELLRRLRNGSLSEKVSIICELQPFLHSFEIDLGLKTKITRTIDAVTDAGRPLGQLVTNTDMIPALVRLLVSSEPPVL
jgi:hypothetical protein